MLIIYDGDPDGILSAVIIGQHLEEYDLEVSYYEAIRNQDPPFHLIDKSTTVVIVDFSYNIEQMHLLADSAKHVVLLDHHATAQEQLEGFKRDNVEIVINQAKSACRISWDYCNTEKAPFIVDYVEDMDLWNWQLPFSTEINSYLSSVPITIPEWKQLMKEDLGSVREKGFAVSQYKNKTIDIIQKFKVTMQIAEYSVPAVNCSDPSLISYLGAKLAKNNPFGAIFYLSPSGKWKFSLRSIMGDENKKGISVRQVAEKYGGGGHDQSAGFFVNNLFPYT